MRAAEIGALIAARAQAWLRGASGVDPVTAADGALTCARMPEMAWYMLQWCYAGVDERDTAAIELRARLLNHAGKLATEERWRAPPGRLRGLVMVALRDIRAEFRKCNGSGDVWRARAAGIDPSGWTRHWRGRYERVYAEAQAIHDEMVQFLVERWQEEQRDLAA